MWFAHNFRRGELAVHYKKHGFEFGPVSRKGYLRRARNFLKQEADGYWVQQNMRGNAWGAFAGDWVRFDITSEEFGIISSLGYIRTYYIPDQTIHAYPTNYDYFLAQS